MLRRQKSYAIMSADKRYQVIQPKTKTLEAATSRVFYSIFARWNYAFVLIAQPTCLCPATCRYSKLLYQLQQKPQMNKQEISLVSFNSPLSQPVQGWQHLYCAILFLAFQQVYIIIHFGQFCTYSRKEKPWQRTATRVLLIVIDLAIMTAPDPACHTQQASHRMPCAQLPQMVSPSQERPVFSADNVQNQDSE